MPTIADALVEDLIADKRLAPVELVGLREARRFGELGFGFVGVRRYWGSMMTVALAVADDLDLQTIADMVGRFHGLTRRLQRYAAEFQDTKFGSFGVAMFLFESGAAPETVAAIRELRHGAIRRDWCVAYALDGRTGRVHQNRGLPMLFPGGRFLRRALHRAMARQPG